MDQIQDNNTNFGLMSVAVPAPFPASPRRSGKRLSDDFRNLLEDLEQQ